MRYKYGAIPKVGVASRWIRFDKTRRDHRATWKIVVITVRHCDTRSNFARMATTTSNQTELHPIFENGPFYMITSPQFITGEVSYFDIVCPMRLTNCSSTDRPVHPLRLRNGRPSQRLHARLQQRLQPSPRCRPFGIHLLPQVRGVPL